jgi:hypothetical protein
MVVELTGEFLMTGGTYQTIEVCVCRYISDVLDWSIGSDTVFIVYIILLNTYYFLLLLLLFIIIIIITIMCCVVVCRLPLIPILTST